MQHGGFFMSKVWEFFENMNEYVYATDIETHEIVYMNRKTLQVYGLQFLLQLF